ncbi:hypothetical protein JTB14_030595 [Gonioctena quinquepunctata]|nr:hypothetical protein JTB14_030595 [Gonioctena quinquepunctata]
METSAAAECIHNIRVIMWFMTIIYLLLFSINGSAGDTDIDNHPAWQYLPAKNECGVARVNFHNRITMGEEAHLGEFPWMVRIGYSKGMLAEKVFHCGGSLISRKHVITAAHCGTKNNVVRIGENDVATDLDCGNGICAPPSQDIRIKKYLIEGLYNKETFAKDISVILLEKDCEFDDYVSPICLPSGSVIHDDVMGATMIVAGWGYTNSHLRSLPSKLMYFTGAVLNQSDCGAIFSNPQDDTQYCIGTYSGSDSCRGDSGGPAMRTLRVDNVRRKFLYGIISYGHPKCGAGPAVYTAVTKYMKIILDKINEFH